MVGRSDAGPRGVVERVNALVPRGWRLPEQAWRSRHNGILIVLWLHVVGVFVFGVARGYPVGHVAIETSGIGTLALAATMPRFGRRSRMIAASLGLLMASAVLTHLSAGSIEMHFHFFVMMPLISLYQDWVPFLISAAFVGVHHGVMGALDPGSVYNHPAAIAQPWKWAIVHTVFIIGINIVCLTTWRFLERALERAVDESRVKSEFLSVFSHEIRTPLTLVIGYAATLAKTNLDALQRECADTISASSKHLLTMINDILDYSKLEAGRLEFQEEPFDVRALVDEVLQLVADPAHANEVTLQSTCDDSVPDLVVGDRGRIAQVLLNLVSNAVKFTTRGRVSVDVTAVDAGGGRIGLTVAVGDTGIGIAPEQLERIFDSFTQAEASITRRYGGTGLGLAISRQLCEAMGGGLHAHSAPGRGSTFFATVKVGADVPASIAPAPSHTPCAGAADRSQHLRATA